MRGISFVVFISLLLLALSSTIPKPPGFEVVENAAARLECAKPACIIALAELGAVNMKFSEKAHTLVYEKGDVWSALALRAVEGSGVDEFENEIGALLEVPLSEARTADENALVARELMRRAAENQRNADLAAKAVEACAWLESHPSRSFVYLYIVSEMGLRKPESLGERAGPAERLVHSYGGFASPAELLFFPSRQQSYLAAEIEKQIVVENDPEALSADIYALTYYYIGRYPGIALKGYIWDIAFIYSLPVALVCIVPLITVLVVNGKERRSRFERERAINILLCGLLVPVIVILMTNALAVIPTFPGAALLVFFVPLLVPLFLYAIVSLRTQREYGVIKEMDLKAVIERAQKLAWVAAAGAFLTLLLSLILLGLQQIREMVNGPIKELVVPTAFIALLLAIMPYLPRVIETMSGSFEIRDEEVKQRLNALASRFGYSAESIRIIPSLESKFTNAIQVGLLGKNVRIFVSENLLDESLFTRKELEAVVAHELAHIQRRHIIKTTVGYVSTYLLLLLLFSAPSLLFEPEENRLMNLFLSAVPYICLIITLLVTLWIRRKFEFEADAVAVWLGYGEELLSALKKIYKMNSMPKRKPSLLKMFSSHGDLEERMRRLYMLQRAKKKHVI